MGLQPVEFLAQAVVQIGIGDADFRALDLHLVSGAGIVQPFARGHQAQAGDIAIA
ncbi:hypothetical protein D3C86_2144030 [compost metagenome]